MSRTLTFLIAIALAATALLYLPPPGAWEMYGWFAGTAAVVIAILILVNLSRTQLLVAAITGIVFAAFGAHRESQYFYQFGCLVLIVSVALALAHMLAHAVRLKPSR